MYMVRVMTQQDKIDKSIYAKEVQKRFNKYYERKIAEDPDYIDKLRQKHNERRREQRINNPSNYARHKLKVKLSYWKKLELSLSKEEFQKRLTRLKMSNPSTFEFLKDNGLSSAVHEVETYAHDEGTDIHA